MSVDTTSCCSSKVYTRNFCVICEEDDEEKKDQAFITKGLVKLYEYCIKVNDNQLADHLKHCEETQIPIRIHRDCQKKIYNVLKRKSDPDSSSGIVKKVIKRSDVIHFKWKECCLFCGDICEDDVKHLDRNKVRKLMTLSFKETVLEACSRRSNDEWTEELKRRTLSCNDFVAEEARYHAVCARRFFVGRSKQLMSTKQLLSSKKTPSAKPVGRLVNKSDQDAFHDLCEWIETKAELYTVKELREKMKNITKRDDVYSCKWLKQKLKIKYEEHIFFAEIHGKSDVVCFKDIASYVLNEKWYTNKCKDNKSEAERVIETAAKLIINNIRNTTFDCSTYPSNDCIENNDSNKQWMPPYLRIFLENLLKDTVKQVSIGHAIVHATHPRSAVPPLTFALGVEMDHVFGSKWLVNHLHKLGFSVSYKEVTRYKQSVLENEDLSEFLQKNLSGSFTQWMADNADHNPVTLDGKGSLHAMGVIAATTNADGLTITNNLKAIPRQELKNSADVIKNAGIPIVPYLDQSNAGLSKIKFRPIMKLQISEVNVLPGDITLLWHSAYFFKNMRSNWTGYMSQRCAGDYPGKSVVSFLPILDLNPNDPTCIYSVLLFITEQATQLNITTPIITFDQPLWLKAIDIVNSKSLPIVVILGGFHLMISYLGSIGSLMSGSGISHALETIYGVNAVKHVITGKAVSRAIRGHILTESALVTKILKHVMPIITENDVEDATDDPQNVCPPQLNKMYVHLN